MTELTLEQICNNARENPEFYSRVEEEILARDFIKHKTGWAITYERKRSTESEVLVLTPITLDQQTSLYRISEGQTKNFRKDLSKLIWQRRNKKLSSSDVVSFGMVSAIGTLYANLFAMYQNFYMGSSFLFGSMLGTGVVGGILGKNSSTYLMEKRYQRTKNNFVRTYGQLLINSSPKLYNHTIIGK